MTPIDDLMHEQNVRALLQNMRAQASQLIGMAELFAALGFDQMPLQDAANHIAKTAESIERDHHG